MSAAGFASAVSENIWRLACLVLCVVLAEQWIAERPTPAAAAAAAGGGALRAPPLHHAASAGAASAACLPHAAPSFWALGLHFMTDKVPQPLDVDQWGGHQYHFPYERYLRPLRCNKVSMLEIGLGCDMGYKKGGAKEGRSIRFWLAFLPNAFVNAFEFQAECARTWYAQDRGEIGRAVLDARVKVWTGDQSSEATLVETMEAMGPQDIIIDDGGHSMMQQQTSLRVLFRYVKPGGIYVVEDLGTSYYQHQYLDKPGGLTMVDYLAHLVASVHSMRYADSLDASVYPGIPELALQVKSVDCFKEACVITKWAEGEPGLEDFPLPAPAAWDQRTGAPLG